MRSKISFLKYKKNIRPKSSILGNIIHFLILELGSSISWNIRNFLILELESSISWNIKKFLEWTSFIFSSLGWKVCEEAPYYTTPATFTFVLFVVIWCQKVVSCFQKELYIRCYKGVRSAFLSYLTDFNDFRNFMIYKINFSWKSWKHEVRERPPLAACFFPKFIFSVNPTFFFCGFSFPWSEFWKVITTVYWCLPTSVFSRVC